MSLNNPKGGLGLAAEFQSSALPYVTASQVPAASTGMLRIDFPKVSRFITIVNREAAGQELRIAFTRNGMTGSGAVGGNYFTLDGGKDITLELRVKEIYLAGNSAPVDCAVCAGLTNIDASMMPVLTGTLPNGDPGWVGVG